MYLPSNQVSSQSRVAGIASRVWVPLERFTGIESTHRVCQGEYSFDLACRAIERALERSSFRPEDIGLLIACNISKYDGAGYLFSIEPNTSTRLRNALGFRNAMAFDLNNACAGMFTGILVADCFLHTTRTQAALVVSGEYISHLSDTAQREITGLTDPRMACLTLGDAGAAVILARSHDGAIGFQHLEMCTLGAFSSLCRGGPTGEAREGAIMITDSAELLRVGALETARHFLASVHDNEWNVDDIDHLIPHQVSKGGTEALLRLINSGLNGKKIPRRKVVDNLAKRGNTATTTHMVALHDQIEKDRIASGDRIVFAITASGLNVGTAFYILDDLPSRMRGAGNGSGASSIASHALAAVEAPPARFPRPAPRTVSIASVATTRLRQAPKSTLEIALEAAEACLSKAPCGREDIQALIFTGVFKSGFLAEPAYASTLAGQLFPRATNGGRANDILAFDLHHGPNGFLAGCEILRAAVERRGLRAGLIIAAEFDNNRLLEGYQRGEFAEVASAAVILPSGRQAVEIGECEFFFFEEFADYYRANAVGVFPVHVTFDVCGTYHSVLRNCIARAVKSYVARTGRTLADFDEFYFPQVSRQFLDALAKNLDLPRDRIVDVTVAGKDLLASSLPFALENAALSRCGEPKRTCLAVSAGPGISVGCAIVRH